MTTEIDVDINKVIREFVQNDVIIYINGNHKVAKICESRNDMNIINRGVLEMNDYKNHTFVNCGDIHLLYNKRGRAIFRYDSIKHVEYDKKMYMFCYYNTGSIMNLCSMIYDHNSNNVIQVNYSLCNADNFNNKTAEELLRKYLSEHTTEFKRDLMYYGARIYKNYYRPNIIQDRLHDLIVIAQGEC